MDKSLRALHSKGNPAENVPGPGGKGLCPCACRMQGAGCLMWGAGCRMLDTGKGMQDARYGMWAQADGLSLQLGMLLPHSIQHSAGGSNSALWKLH